MDSSSVHIFRYDDDEVGGGERAMLWFLLLFFIGLDRRGLTKRTASVGFSDSAISVSSPFCFLDSLCWEINKGDY